MESYGQAQGWIGASVRRKEDGRLLVGEGNYFDDVALADTLHVAILRSPHAHARIRSVDLAAARACPGVVVIADGATVREQLGPLPSGGRKQTEYARVTGIDPRLVPLLRMETQPLL